MAKVSVDVAAVDGAIALCKRVIDEFNKTSNDLTKKVQEVGSQWKDNKYQQLVNVTTDCVSAIDKPIKELQNCQTKLGELRKAIIAYEQS